MLYHKRTKQQNKPKSQLAHDRMGVEIKLENNTSPQRSLKQIEWSIDVCMYVCRLHES